jgi:hypothetical protein
MVNLVDQCIARVCRARIARIRAPLANLAERGRGRFPWCTHLGKPWDCGSGRQPRDRFGSRPCENGWSRGVERPWASSVPDRRSSHVPAAEWRGRHGAARLFEPDDRLEPAEIEVCIGLYLVA